MQGIKKISAILFALTVLGCGEGQQHVSPETDPPASDIQGNTNELLIHPFTIRGPWPTPVIPVCWQGPSGAAERLWVKDAIEKTWMKVSQVTFTGWGDCTSTPNNGIRIRVADEGPSALVGTEIKNSFGGMTLNFSYSLTTIPVDPGILPCSHKDKREQCIRVDAIHEFGHALGFRHEQNHPQSTCPKDVDYRLDGGTIDLDGYDTDSVMNYCNSRYRNREWPYVLSSNDVRGVQTVYGGKSGTLGGYWGKCIGTRNSQLTHGAIVETQSCGWGITQTWDMAFDYGTPFHRLQQRGQPRYLTVPAGNHAPGTFTQIRAWENYLDSQQFIFTDFLIRSYNNHCLGTADGTLNSGTFVQTRRCDWIPAVRFNFDGGAKKLRIGSKCLEAENAPTAGWFAPRAKINDCRQGAREQEWEFKPNGQLANQGKCLAYTSFNSGNGVFPFMQACATDNSILQHWALRGPVVHRPKNQATTCLDVYYQTNAPYTPVQIYTCNGTLAQEFNYFP